MKHLDWNPVIVVGLITIVAAISAVRIWQGKARAFGLQSDGIPKVLTDTYRRSASASIMSPFVFGSMTLIGIARYGTELVTNEILKVALYVLLVASGLLCAVAFVALVSLYFTGKPKWLVPPPFRDQ